MGKILPEIGQVWISRDITKDERYCIIAVDMTRERVMVSGTVDQVSPVFTFEYLHRMFKPEEGWRI